MFVLKKLVVPLLLPASVCLELLLGGLILLWLSPRQRAGKVVVSIGTGLLAASLYTVVSDNILKPLESRYSPAVSAAALQANLAAGESLKWVVVLSAGSRIDPTPQADVRLAPESLVRLAEGVRIWRGLSGARLLLSGGPDVRPVSEADLMADAAQHVFGVSRDHLVLETRSVDTRDEAVLIGPIVGRDRFVLVTSASHMPRSMALFTKLGLSPIAAPTYFLMTGSPASAGDLYPRPAGLANVQRACHEYWGLLWATLTRQI